MDWLTAFEMNGLPPKKGKRYGRITQKNRMGERRDESRKNRVVVGKKVGSYV